MGRRRLPERGFTIIEVVVAAAVSGLVATTLFAAFAFTLKFVGRGRAEVEAQRLARIALAILVSELRESLGDADTIAVWSIAAGDAVDAVGFVSPRQETDGQPFRADAAGNPLGSTVIYYVFNPADRTLRRVVRPWEGLLISPPIGEGRIVAPGTSGASFQRERDLVTITLRVAADRGEATLQAVVSPRN